MDTRIICLTPVKDEAWILETFLAAASVWADHIVIADQMSTDGSREIASRFDKVRIVDNRSIVFNEPERQKLLIAAGREYPCDRRILVALDADEILSGNLERLREPSFDSVLPGTTLRFPWWNVAPGGTTYWSAGSMMPFGYVDDGAEHRGDLIHSMRIPGGQAMTGLDLDDMPVLHLQYIDWDRMRSKHRWYECFERMSYPQKSALEIYRRYHHMYSHRQCVRKPMESGVLSSYSSRGIDPLRFSKDGAYRWDGEVADMIAQGRSGQFRNLDIWDRDWSADLHAKGVAQAIELPRRGMLERSIAKYARMTQRFYPNTALKAIDLVLGRFYR